MPRTYEDARRWTQAGTELLTKAVAGLGEEQFAEPTPLPGWTRMHLIAHVAANADALGNLVHWAATATEIPMYASPQERQAGIDQGATLPPADLVAWLTTSAQRLDEAMDQLTQEQWQREVRTGQGRTVPATEVPWMRAREVMVHAVDLGTGIGFADLPDDFNEALSEDIRSKRGEVPAVDGPLAEVTAWLAGRPHALADAPEIGAWL